MLEKFRQAKQAEIRALQAMAAVWTLPEPLQVCRPSLRRALLEQSPGAVIAEYKRASPSKGLINAGWFPEQAASGYARAGAAALSVLTEQTYFQGRLEYLDAMAGPGLPLLRKDFLLHPLQVRQSAATPASAVLLIARMLTPHELATMLAACDEFGLEAVVEIFDQADLDRAKHVGARIIQVNNRDLDTLSTDLGVSLELIGRKSADEVWISASGLQTARDMARMRDAGFDGLLMGTRLMQAPDPGAVLAGLLKQMRKA
ncbi:MAG TPA: indole-3-glycerol-phosphate synthase [Desulfonatronum sp.]|nr:indole-3-glycerol-phosphate synthase [Desulfonatronum sp.]